MSDDTPRLGLPYLITSQAQKEVTHNEALNRLDALVQAVVLDRGLTAPPAGAADGDCYLIAAGASGDWAGRDGQIAAWYGGWVFVAPRAGFAVHVADEDVTLRHDGGVWAVAEAARLDRVQTFTAAQRQAYVTLADGATVTVDFALGNKFRLTLAGNRTMDTPTGLAAGQGGVIKIVQDATGGRTLSWAAAWKWQGGAPALSAAGGAVDLIGYEVEDDGATITAWMIAKGRG